MPGSILIVDGETDRQMEDQTPISHLANGGVTKMALPNNDYIYTKCSL